MIEGPFHDTELDNAGPESTHYLRKEGYALGHFKVEAEFQVLQEEMGLVHCDVAVGFEKHHCQGSAWLHISNDIFSKNIQAEMNIRRGIYDSDGNRPDQGDQEGND